MSITWSQALSWRMQRHLLEPVGREPVEEVVRRLGAVPAMDECSAERAVAARRIGSRLGDLGAALADGRVIKAFAFRGAMHYLSPADGGAYLALRSSSRQWERPSWRRHYRLEPADWPAFRQSVREALEDGPLTITEIGAVVTRKAAYRHLRPIFDEGADTLVKPLTWQGDMSLGPPRGGRHTFQRPADNPRWAGVWDLDEAGPHAIRSYFRHYGPATYDHLHYWLGEGLSVGRTRLRGWLEEITDHLVAVDVEGRTAYLMDEDVDALMAARPTGAVRLLPGHDQWVMGPGTKDEHVVPPARRALVTKKADLVVADGVVSGTWRARDGEIEVAWFTESGAPPEAAIHEEVEKLATTSGRPLGLSRVVAS